MSDCSCRLATWARSRCSAVAIASVNRKRVQVLLGEVPLFQERRPGILADCRQMGIVTREIGEDAGSVAVRPTDLIRKALLHGSRGSQPEQERAFRRLLLRHALPVPRNRFRCPRILGYQNPMRSEKRP